jgi:hypothetical protein
MRKRAYIRRRLLFVAVHRGPGSTPACGAMTELFTLDIVASTYMGTHRFHRKG